MRENAMQDVVIAGYRRSPFAFAEKGGLAKVRPDDMAATVVRQLVTDTGVKGEEIDDVIFGCAFPEAEQGLNIGRLVGFLAQLPDSVPGATVNRFCGSSMQAIHMAAGAIRMNAGEAFVCGGVESMTRVPMPGFNPLPNPGLYARFPQAYMGMGETAENLARRYQIPREAQEEFALSSHAKAAAAQQGGRFKEEIVRIEDRGSAVEADGCIRPDTSREALAGLAPAFDRDGTVTAGTSAPLTDGAAAVLVCSQAFAERHNLVPLARVKSIAVAGCPPEIMGIGPVVASQRALERAGLDIGDMDIIELNEAFAVQVLACVRDLRLDTARLNIDGGALALGHPLGASGARITGKAAALLKREGGRYALATMCIGGGQGIATVLEAVP
jgi:acetyl-CoA acyltransferase